MQLRHCIFLLMLASLTACKTFQREPVIRVGSDPAAVDLAQAAVAVNASLKDLAHKTQQQASVQLKTKAISPQDYGMGQIASVDWVGPVEPLLTKLMQLTHYQLKVFGKEPVMPILVSVSERERYVADILRDISLQSKDAIKLVVFPSTHVVELHYLSQSS